jgi:hypothetical protein
VSLPATRSRAARRPTPTGDSAPRPPSVFISHATTDGADYAARLDRELRQHRVDTWLCARDMYEAVDFTSELEHAIDAADRFIACITSDVLRPNSYVRREIAYAELCGKPIAVARFVRVRPPISVVTKTFFEFHQDWETAFGRLLTFCRGGGGTPARDR